MGGRETRYMLLVAGTGAVLSAGSLFEMRRELEVWRRCNVGVQIVSEENLAQYRAWEQSVRGNGTLKRAYLS